MKKLLSGLCMLGLCTAGMVYLNSCAKQAGPLNPSVPLTSASDAHNRNMPLISSIVAPAGISQSAQVIFTVPMSASTFVKDSSVILYTSANDTTTSETQFSSYSLSYNAVNKTLYIIPDANSWANDRRYHVMILPGVQSLQGLAMDGNQNHLAEAAEFDSIHRQFTVGAPTAASYINLSAGAPLKHSARLSLSGMGVYTEAWGATMSASFGDSQGNLPTTNPYYITMLFNNSLKRDTVVLATASTPAYTVLLTDNGSLVAPSFFGVTSTAVTDDTVQIVINSLTPGHTYKLKLFGGVNGLRSSIEATQTLLKGLYFDGDADGMAEASDDTKELTVQAQPAIAIPYVCVTGAAIGDANSLITPGGDRRIVISFSIPTATHMLDASTVNTTNFRLVDSVTGQAITPSSLVLDNSLASATDAIVHMFVPMKFDSTTSNVSHTILVIVTKDVKSSDGYSMDNNGNGIQGENTDNYISPSPLTAISYGQ